MSWLLMPDSISDTADQLGFSHKVISCVQRDCSNRNWWCQRANRKEMTKTTMLVLTHGFKGELWLTFRGNYFISLKMISASCLLSNTNKTNLEQMSLCRFEHALHNSENLDKLLRVYGSEIFVTAIVFWSTIVIFCIKTIGDTLMLRWFFVG